MINKKRNYFKKGNIEEYDKLANIYKKASFDNNKNLDVDDNSSSHKSINHIKNSKSNSFSDSQSLNVKSKNNDIYDELRFKDYCKEDILKNPDYLNKNKEEEENKLLSNYFATGNDIKDAINVIKNNNFRNQNQKDISSPNYENINFINEENYIEAMNAQNNFSGNYGFIKNIESKIKNSDNSVNNIETDDNMNLANNIQNKPVNILPKKLENGDNFNYLNHQFSNNDNYFFTFSEAMKNSIFENAKDIMCNDKGFDYNEKNTIISNSGQKENNDIRIMDSSRDERENLKKYSKHNKKRNSRSNSLKDNYRERRNNESKKYKLNNELNCNFLNRKNSKENENSKENYYHNINRYNNLSKESIYNKEKKFFDEKTKKHNYDNGNFRYQDKKYFINDFNNNTNLDNQYYQKYNSKINNFRYKYFNDKKNENEKDFKIYEKKNKTFKNENRLNKDFIKESKKNAQKCISSNLNTQSDNSCEKNFPIKERNCFSEKILSKSYSQSQKTFSSRSRSISKEKENNKRKSKNFKENTNKREYNNEIKEKKIQDNYNEKKDMNLDDSIINKNQDLITSQSFENLLKMENNKNKFEKNVKYSTRKGEINENTLEIDFNKKNFVSKSSIENNDIKKRRISSDSKYSSDSKNSENRTTYYQKRRSLYKKDLTSNKFYNNNSKNSSLYTEIGKNRIIDNFNYHENNYNKRKSYRKNSVDDKKTNSNKQKNNNFTNIEENIEKNNYSVFDKTKNDFFGKKEKKNYNNSKDYKNESINSKNIINGNKIKEKISFKVEKKITNNQDSINEVNNINSNNNSNIINPNNNSNVINPNNNSNIINPNNNSNVINPNNNSNIFNPNNDFNIREILKEKLLPNLNLDDDINRISKNISADESNLKLNIKLKDNENVNSRKNSILKFQENNTNIVNSDKSNNQIIEENAKILPCKKINITGKSQAENDNYNNKLTNNPKEINKNYNDFIDNRKQNFNNFYNNKKYFKNNYDNNNNNYKNNIIIKNNFNRRKNKNFNNYFNKNNNSGDKDYFPKKNFINDDRNYSSSNIQIKFNNNSYLEDSRNNTNKTEINFKPRDLQIITEDGKKKIIITTERKNPDIKLNKN